MQDFIRPDPSISPREIFARMQGAWLEPRQGSMWQENTGATATASGGQTIGLLLDQSGSTSFSLFSPTGQTARGWRGFAVLGTDVYAVVYNGLLYKQTNGAGVFTAVLDVTARGYQQLAVYNGELYATVYGGGIYKWAGTGDFTVVDANTRNWNGIAVNGLDIYACVYGGDIYKQTGGTGTFDALGGTSRNWTAMATLNGNVYASVDGGSIYKQTGGTGAFVSLGVTNRAWAALCSDGRDLFAAVWPGDIYQQKNATGDFVALNQTSRTWSGLTSYYGKLYASVNSFDIFISRPGNHASQATAANRPLLGARVNLLANTEDFSSTYCLYQGVDGYSANAATAPDGTLTADFIRETNTTGDHRIGVFNNGVTFEAGKSYIYTVYVKRAAGTRHIGLVVGFGTGNFGNYVLRFNLDALSYNVQTPTNYTAASISQLSGGWYKLNITGFPTSTLAGTYTVGIIMLSDPSNTNTAYTGDGTSGFYVWGRDLRPTVDANKDPAPYQRVTTATDYDAGRFPAIRHADSTDVLAAAMPAINVRRNLLTYSEQFDNAAWLKTNCSVAGSVIDNGFYGQKISVTSNGEVVLYQFGLPTQGTAHRFTVVAKALGTTQYLVISCAYIWAVNGLVRAWFDIKNGVVAWAALEDAPSVDISATTCSITPVSAGGYECVFAPPVRTGSVPQFGFGVSSANKGIGGMSGKEFILARAQVTLASEPNNTYQKITDWTSEAYSSAGSVYFATPVGMSALHNQSIGTTYNLPALQTDIYGTVITPARLAPPLEQRLALYMHRLAGLSDADFFWQEQATDGMTGQLLADDNDTILLRA